MRQTRLGTSNLKAAHMVKINSNEKLVKHLKITIFIYEKNTHTTVKIQ